MTTLFGIKNCDSVKKARNWLQQHGVDYQFHDLRSDGLTAMQLQQWIDAVGWERLLNKRSTTWKQLDSTVRDNIDLDSASKTMLEQPTLIKRPVLDTGHDILVGFSDASYGELFQRHTL